MKTEQEWLKTFENFIGYFARYDSELRSKLLGASSSDIRNIETLAGVKLPPEYATFLRAMGRTPQKTLGAFLEYVNFGIQAILDFYSDPESPPLPRNMIYLWTYQYDATYDIFIRADADLDVPRPLIQYAWAFDKDGQVVKNKPPVGVVFAESLLSYLYREAFWRIRDSVLPCRLNVEQASLEGKPDSALEQRQRKDFRALADRLGFEPVPHLEEKLVFYNRTDASMELIVAKFARDRISIKAKDETELLRLSEIVCDNLGFFVE